MEIREHLHLPIQDSSQISDARRRGTLLAKQFGFSDELVGRIALVITECGTNLIKHTPEGGVIIAQVISLNDVLGIEILALDKGPGIANPAEALRDGYSTAGSPGTGLGAISRLSDTFDIYSMLNEGTAVLSRIWTYKSSPYPLRITSDFGALNIPKTGEPVSGDSWAIHREKERVLLVVADGLGHGLGASQASREAIKCFFENTQRDPVEIIKAMHLAIQGTRGAVVGVAELDLVKQQVNYAGVGNIEGSLYAGEDMSRFVSHNGTAGYDIGRVKAFSYPCPDGSIIVLSSDGLNSHLNLNRYLGLKSKDAALIAAVLFRDFNRGRDDASVLVFKTAAKRPLVGG
ncbi:MAG: SpoIIE family protein phosphatase [Anaerolineae bacterium]|nr:SpoIIE family protein phosphatase [Anaerolineae bacterium]